MLSRRTALLSGLTALAFPIAGTRAAEQCSAPFGNRECIAGLQLGSIETARQRCENWCWAACIETVFAIKGARVSQERIVQKLFGDQRCQAANTYQVFEAVAGQWTDDDGRRFNARADEVTWAGFAARNSRDDSGGYGPGSTQGYRDLGALKIVTSLKNEEPLIVGSIPLDGRVGHAMLLTAVRYKVRSSGNMGPESINLTSLIVRDPWPSNPNRRELDESEVRGAVVALKIGIR